MSFVTGWLQDNRSEDIFRNEMFESAYTYFEECDTYMVRILSVRYTWPAVPNCHS